VNEDVIGWIYVEAIEDINYPVVKGKDNDEYLHMTYEGNYNFAGTIFIDCENSGDFSDCNTLVYGHNMKNGSMFGQLKKFTQNSETYEKSKYFWIFTPEASYRYEIISAYVTSVSSDTYTLFKGPGEEFLKYLDKIKGYSELAVDDFETDVKDKVVTLSTCTGNEATRYVVQGIRTDTILVN
jgi:sortase B